MKKIKISLTMATLILAIAGTATASKTQKKLDTCEEKDPLMIICTDTSLTPCCEMADNPWIIHYERS